MEILLYQEIQERYYCLCFEAGSERSLPGPLPASEPSASDTDGVTLYLAPPWPQHLVARLQVANAVRCQTFSRALPTPNPLRSVGGGVRGAPDFGADGSGATAVWAGAGVVPDQAFSLDTQPPTHLRHTSNWGQAAGP